MHIPIWQIIVIVLIRQNDKSENEKKSVSQYIASAAAILIL